MPEPKLTIDLTVNDEPSVIKSNILTVEPNCANALVDNDEAIVQ
jgi:hypothetical protein